MVAIINHSKNVRDVLNYNERKVVQGKADLILASKFLCDIDELSFKEKLKRFALLNQNNPKAKTNTLHISLNFDPSEKLDSELLQKIAISYMEKIGFAEQPYLVYRHRDAAHPHIHLITSLVQVDGKRINTHNIGRLASEPARKQIEQDFALKVAGKKEKNKSIPDIQAIQYKPQYGKDETKEAIAKVVSFVVKEYRFTSIHELNAALKQFNIIADTGLEGSYLRHTEGIQYRMINAKGEKVGVPIKASSLTGKPTMKSLRKKFQVNELLRKNNKQVLVDTINNVLNKNSSITSDQFRNILGRNNIAVVFRVNDNGRMFGVTYVDNNTRCVFNGSDLGKSFSAGALAKALIVTEQPTTTAFKTANGYQPDSLDTAGVSGLLNDLARSQDLHDYLPSNLKPKKKRKRRNKPNS